MKASKIDVYLIDNKTFQSYNNVDWFKEPFGISIKAKANFPNINKDGEVELFIPYTSILKIKVAIIDNQEV